MLIQLTKSCIVDQTVNGSISLYCLVDKILKINQLWFITAHKVIFSEAFVYPQRDWGVLMSLPVMDSTPTPR